MIDSTRDRDRRGKTVGRGSARRRAAWIRANRPAIEDFNRRVGGRGVYGDRARRF